MDRWQGIGMYEYVRVRHRIRINTEEMAKVVAATWKTELIQFLATLAILHQDDLKKRMNRLKATGCFEKLVDQLVHTTPSHHPPKMDVLAKTFLQFICAPKWLVQHSRTSPPNSSNDLFAFPPYLPKILSPQTLHGNLKLPLKA